MPTKKGSIRLFRLAGVDVYVHWAWFLAFIYFTSRPHEYTNYGWNALEVLALFAIVLTHEFGHQLACRQVGGQTQDIVLWPLGGVAYVNPPQRPGAQLWSIAAGPLVNVALVPVFVGLVMHGRTAGWDSQLPNGFMLLTNIRDINFILLIFNLMPVYPLDGGQILRSLLWFIFGRANSLMAASIIGFIGVAGLILLAIYAGSVWLGIMAAFILISCWGGLKQARVLARVAKIPRRPGFACPACKNGPPLGTLWRCGKCGNNFDTFATLGACPQCGTQFSLTQCLDCGARFPIIEWKVPLPVHEGDNR